MKTFTRLAQANVDHYNAHPTKHTALTGVYAVTALVVIVKVAKRLRKEDPTLTSGQYAN